MGVAANKEGLSEAAVLTATGKHPHEWFALLDAAGATAWTHTQIARWLHTEHDGIDGWWAQSITVRYEQERGLRLPGQQSDGTFAESVSRAIPLNPQRALEAVIALVTEQLGTPPVATNPAARYPTARWVDASGEGLLATLTVSSPTRVSVALTRSKIAHHDRISAATTELSTTLSKLLRTLH
jgi:hypothetical protein